MIRSWQKRFLRPRQAGTARTCRPAVEVLEDRLTPSTIQVTDPRDAAGSANDVTLRYALANAQSGDVIDFGDQAAGLQASSSKPFKWTVTPIHVKVQALSYTEVYGDPSTYPSLVRRLAQPPTHLSHL